MSSPITTAQTTARLSSNILHISSSLRNRSLIRHAVEDFGFSISDLSSLFSICQKSLLSYTSASDVQRYLEQYEISDRLEEEIWILNRRIKLVRPKLKSLRGVRLEWMARIRYSGFRVEVEALKCDVEGVKSLLVLVLLVMNLEEELSGGRDIEIKETRDQLKSTTRTLLHTQSRSVTAPDYHSSGRDRIFALQDTILQLAEHMSKHGTVPAILPAAAEQGAAVAGKRRKKTASKTKSSERLKKRRRQQEGSDTQNPYQDPALGVGVTFRPQRAPPSIVDFPSAEPAVQVPPRSAMRSPASARSSRRSNQSIPYPSTSSVAAAGQPAATVPMPEIPPTHSSSTLQQAAPPSRPSSVNHHPPSRPSSTTQPAPPPSRPSSAISQHPVPPPPPAQPISRPSSTAPPPMIVVHDADASIAPKIISPKSSASKYAAYVSDEHTASRSGSPSTTAGPSTSPAPAPAAVQIREGWINGQRARAIVMSDLDEGNFITDSYARTLPGVVIDSQHQKARPPVLVLDGVRYESIGIVSFRWTEDEHRGNSFTVHCEVIRKPIGSTPGNDLIFGRPYVKKRQRYISS